MIKIETMKSEFVSQNKSISKCFSKKKSLCQNVNVEENLVRYKLVFVGIIFTFLTTIESQD
jgi:hypothetical protein